MSWYTKRIEFSDIRRRTEWHAYVRLLFLLAFILPGLTTVFIFDGWSEQLRFNIAISVVAIASNLLLFGLISVRGTRKYLLTMSAIWVGLDILLIAWYYFSNGGIESRTSILFIIPMLIAAALYGRKGLYVTSLVSASVYAILLILDFTGIVNVVGTLQPELHRNLPYYVKSMLVVPSMLIVVAVGVDFITRMLRDKEAELTQTVTALETAQAIAKVGSWDWDIVNNEISWSKELYQIYGFRPRANKMKYDQYRAVLGGDGDSDYNNVIRHAIKNKSNFQFDRRLRMADNSTRYLHIEGIPILDNDGNVIKLAGTTQDVTDIYLLDDAKREFVSLASHQLRTPASGVKAFLSLLLDGYTGKLTAGQKRFIMQAYEANDRQLEIIDNLLNLASIESGKMTVNREPRNLKNVIASSIPANMPQARHKKQKIEFRKPRKAVVCAVDEGVLRMALDNFISNAIKYSPERARITIELRATERFAYIDVTDTGIGIAAKDIPALFKKFSRLNDPASQTVGGSGLGLYMAKHIIELHRGRVVVRSKHGLGTTFTIKLPLSKQRAVK